VRLRAGAGAIEAAVEDEDEANASSVAVEEQVRAGEAVIGAAGVILK
jgi:hypothetical protein